MTQFQCDVIAGKEIATWIMRGQINEFATFPPTDSIKSLTIDLKNVTSINSYGVKIWCQWMKTNRNLTSITLENCPYTIVHNLSLVLGFINENTTITSFFVPFVNEESDESSQVLFTLGKDFQTDGFLSIPIVKDSKGNAMELDVNPSTYFSFLKKQSKQNKKSTP